MRTNYTFSVITACYNVEHYLDEAVQRLLEQDVGFEEHIQLVLVDDGSTDRTGDICNKYAQLYPDNIEVIHQSNAGVSAARNAGLERVKGEWVILMDADDKFSPDFFSKVGEILQKHGSETRVTVVPICFDGRQGAPAFKHIYKKGSRMIDLEEAGEADGSSIRHFRTAEEAAECLIAMEKTIQKAHSQGNRQVLQAMYARLLDHNFWKSFKGLLGNANVQYRLKRVFARMPWETWKVQAHDIICAVKEAKTFLPNRPNRKGIKKLCEYARRMLLKKAPPRVNTGEIITPAPAAATDPCTVSIIVPVYNVEKYLHCCLDSLSGQTHKNMEIICVDDGSTDSSPTILAEAAAKDPRIKVVHQENGGLSAARNTGLRHATAPYITFVDSDDWLEPDAIGKALAYMLCDPRVDLVCYLAETEYEDIAMRYEQQVTGSQSYHACKYEGLHAMDASVICNSTVTVWNKLFKKELIDQWELRFPQGLLFEDTTFFASYALHARYAYFIGEALYHYRQRLDSIMGKTLGGKMHRRADVLQNFVLIYKHYEQHGALEEYKGVVNRFLSSYLFSDYRRNDSSGKKFVLDFATKIAQQCDPKLFTPGLVDKLRRRRYHKIEQLNYYTFRQKLFTIRKMKGKRIMRLLGLTIRL